MSCSPTVTELAALLGVNRRRISKWRKEGAPQTLEHADWRAWFAGQKSSTRRAIGRRLPTATIVDTPQPDEPTLPAEPFDPEARDRALASKAHEQALMAKLQRERLEGKLVRTADVAIIFAELGAALTGLLRDGIWLAIRPQLDQLTESQRRALRRTHDQAVIDIRQKITNETETRLRAAMKGQP